MTNDRLRPGPFTDEIVDELDETTEHILNMIAKGAEKWTEKKAAQYPMTNAERYFYQMLAFQQGANVFAAKFLKTSMMRQFDLIK